MLAATWSLRPDGHSLDSYNEYRNHPTTFTLKINHGDADTFSAIEVQTMVKDLGYVHKDLQLYYKIPKCNLDIGIKPLSCDKDVIEMCQYVSQYKVMDVFVIHPISEPELVSNEDIDNEFDPLFRNINPCNGPDMWPESDTPITLTPPNYKPPVGRPRKKRRKSAAEIYDNLVKKGKLSRAGKTVTCLKCGQQGHNKRSCKGQRQKGSASGSHAPPQAPSQTTTHASAQAPQSSTQPSQAPQSSTQPLQASQSSNRFTKSTCVYSKSCDSTLDLIFFLISNLNSFITATSPNLQ
ncbi:transposase, MuDR [Tanacetum coccineum]|uniref:Transposase, MuDR n=1 Tax=Tanacetum coccineum TaxID=301880 RepID=A0ABQ5AZG4_9ASTR